MNTLKQQVAQVIEDEPKLLPAAIAQQLKVSEFDVVAALPDDMVAVMAGEQAQSILEELVSYGPVTTIMHSFGSIFEVKAPFPKGKLARGYYNLMGRNGERAGNGRSIINCTVPSTTTKRRQKGSFGLEIGGLRRSVQYTEWQRAANRSRAEAKANYNSEKVRK